MPIGVDDMSWSKEYRLVRFANEHGLTIGFCEERDGAQLGVQVKNGELAEELKTSNPRHNRLSCAGSARGGEKCCVVSLVCVLLRLSFSQAASKRRPIIQAIGPEPVIRIPHLES